MRRGVQSRSLGALMIHLRGAIVARVRGVGGYGGMEEL
jgi:hypothetical protein